MKIVLASESASRRRAMDILGLPYEVRPSRIDEKAIRERDPERLARTLAEAKARKVAETVPDAIIVSGDAVVSKAGKIYEKPLDVDEAFQFLKEFSGKTIEFVTAVTVLNSETVKLSTAAHRSQLTFRNLSGSEIHDYIRRYDVLRFAGAFDGDGTIRFVDHVSGSYNFATGVALNDLVSLLREHGVEI
jgi:septum formation protein